jgi:hypothetical protein
MLDAARGRLLRFGVRSHRHRVSVMGSQRLLWAALVVVVGFAAIGSVAVVYSAIVPHRERELLDAEARARHAYAISPAGRTEIQKRQFRAAEAALRAADEARAASAAAAAREAVPAMPVAPAFSEPGDDSYAPTYYGRGSRRGGSWYRRNRR